MERRLRLILPVDMWDELEALSRASGLPLNRIVALAITEWLNAMSGAEDEGETLAR